MLRPVCLDKNKVTKNHTTANSACAGVLAIFEWQDHFRTVYERYVKDRILV